MNYITAYLNGENDTITTQRKSAVFALFNYSLSYSNNILFEVALFRAHVFCRIKYYHTQLGLNLGSIFILNLSQFPCQHPSRESSMVRSIFFTEFHYFIVLLPERSINHMNCVKLEWWINK